MSAVTTVSGVRALVLACVWTVIYVCPCAACRL